MNHRPSTLAAVLLVLASCKSAKPAPAVPTEPAPPPIAMVHSSVVATSCPEVTKFNARQAENAIKKLVEPCERIPGGAARFTATMLPGGQIQLGSPEGDPVEGTVPTCVTKNVLTHKVFLRKACVFQVELEERPINAPPPAQSQTGTDS